MSGYYAQQNAGKRSSINLNIRAYELALELRHRRYPGRKFPGGTLGFFGPDYERCRNATRAIYASIRLWAGWSVAEQDGLCANRAAEAGFTETASATMAAR
jgi:hypothetical protein